MRAGRARTAGPARSATSISICPGEGGYARLACKALARGMRCARPAPQDGWPGCARSAARRGGRSAVLHRDDPATGCGRSVAGTLFPHRILPGRTVFPDTGDGLAIRSRRSCRIISATSYGPAAPRAIRKSSTPATSPALPAPTPTSAASSIRRQRGIIADAGAASATAHLVPVYPPGTPERPQARQSRCWHRRVTRCGR